MITSNDRLFCLLLLTDTPISIGRLNCSTYILQKIGLCLDYHFRINVSGVRSKSFSRFLEEQVATGVALQNNGFISLSKDSSYLLENFVLSFDDLSKLDKVQDILSKLSDDELHLVCVVDMIIEDMIKTKGVNGLVTERKFIESSIENLCSAYSQENFNSAISLLRNLKKECMLNE